MRSKPSKVFRYTMRIDMAAWVIGLVIAADDRFSVSDHVKKSAFLVLVY